MYPLTENNQGPLRHFGFTPDTPKAKLVQHFAGWQNHFLPQRTH